MKLYQNYRRKFDTAFNTIKVPALNLKIIWNLYEIEKLFCVALIDIKDYEPINITDTLYTLWELEN